MAVRRWQGRFGAVEELVRAYAGEQADDAPGQPGRALMAYLRMVGRRNPAALAVTAYQLRDLAKVGVVSPDGYEMFSALPWPVDGGQRPWREWLGLVAGLLEQAADEPSLLPPDGAPETHWEWNQRFPDLGELLGCWFSQDMPDEFPGDSAHDDALQAWRATAEPDMAARVHGQARELAALASGGVLDDVDLAVGLAELGMECEVPAGYTWTSWLERIAAVAMG